MNLLSFFAKTKVYDLAVHERIRQRSDDSKALKYYTHCPGVMQRSQERKPATLWGPRAHLGANIPMKIVKKFVIVLCYVKHFAFKSALLTFL